MFSVKPDAQAAIASFFAENPDIEKILRVYVTPGSCNGPMLSIMSDQVDPTDVAEEIGGVTFCMAYSPIPEHISNFQHTSLENYP